MSSTHLKSLHHFLRLLENAAELKRRMPPSSNQRTLKEGMAELCRIIGIEGASFKQPTAIAALIGSQRFVMIGGEPSMSERVARIADHTKVILAVVIDPARFDKAGVGQTGPVSGGAMQSSSQRGFPADRAAAKTEAPSWQVAQAATPESQVDSLKPFLAGNIELTSKLFRALFEHMLGVAQLSTAPGHASSSLINDFTGNREHDKSFMTTTLAILGPFADKDQTIFYLMEQGFYGMPILEQLTQGRDYCEAYLSFRRLGRAFIGTVTEEETRIALRASNLNATLGGQPSEPRILTGSEQDKIAVDAHDAALDLLEALSNTTYNHCLTQAATANPYNCIRSIKAIAGHFETFSRGNTSREKSNLEISEHLIAFARQFSEDAPPSTLLETSTT